MRVTTTSLAIWTVLAACSAPVEPTSSSIASEPSCARSGFALHAVDNDSLYMQKVFAAIGVLYRVEAASQGLREGDANDPIARGLGIRADVDMWKAPDGKLQRDYYLTAPDRTTLERFVKDLAKRPGFEIPPDRLLLVEAPDPPRHEQWRTYFLHPQKILDAAAVAEVSLVEDEATGPIAGMTLTADGRTRLAAASAAQLGKKYATVLDGTVVTAAVIMGPITLGGFSIRSRTQDRAGAETLVSKLSCNR